MKKIVFLFSFLIFAEFAFSQVNLVPNPGFEDTVNCPFAPDEMFNATGWSSYGASPDYMNSCCLYSMGVPYNWGGYQQAMSGNAYAAFATYVNTIPNYREFIGCQLLSPLAIGTRYYVSFNVCLSIGSSADANCASDKIGAMFSTVPYTVSSAPITNNPPVYSDSIVTDSLNWTRIFGSIIPDSAFTYIIVGNFFDDNNTDTIKYYTTFSDAAYYYLDDVCVSTDSLYALNYVYTDIPENYPNNSFNIYPNPAQDYVFIENNNEVYDLKIYNAFGQELYFKKDLNDNLFVIDLKDFSQGLYFITISSKNYNLNYKLLKQ